MDSKQYDGIVREAKAIFIERQKLYGNSVDVVNVSTLVGLMLMKLYRLYELGKHGINHPKSKDELLDVLNYSIFALDKLKEEK